MSKKDLTDKGKPVSAEPETTTQQGGGKKDPLPTLGRIVIYTSKIDNGPGNEVRSPAMVVRTRATTVPSVVERWAALPEGSTAIVGKDDVVHETGMRPAGLVAELPDDETVDLVVFGLGKDYREYAVPRGDGNLGTWDWPARA